MSGKRWRRPRTERLTESGHLRLSGRVGPFSAPLLLLWMPALRYGIARDDEILLEPGALWLFRCFSLLLLGLVAEPVYLFYRLLAGAEDPELLSMVFNVALVALLHTVFWARLGREHESATATLLRDSDLERPGN